MKTLKKALLIGATSLALSGCDYIVKPECNSIGKVEQLYGGRLGVISTDSKDIIKAINWVKNGSYKNYFNDSEYWYFNYSIKFKDKNGNLCKLKNDAEKS